MHLKVIGRNLGFLDFRFDQHEFQFLEPQYLAVVVVAVGISYISSLGAELFALEVFRQPSWFIHFRLGCTVSELVPLECSIPKTWR